MHIRRHEQRTIFEAIAANLIADYAELRMDSELARLDEILDDDELIRIVHQALGRRHPNSRTTGRPSTPSEVVLRLLVLKHMRNWSFDRLEQEVRGSLVYRQFARLGWEKMPDAKALIRLSNALGPEILRQLHERVIGIGKEEKVVRGRKLRVDTTVVESNIRYPTDSRLLGDCIRVIIRVGKKLEEKVGAGFKKLRDRMRGTSRRILEIALSSRVHTDASEYKRRRLYQRLMATTRQVVRDASKIVARAARKARTMDMDVVSPLVSKLKEAIRMAERVVEQTRARVIGGDVHFENKILSIFETHTEAIRKGKASKPTEFGKMVKIQEAENQIVTDYLVEPTRRPDSDLLIPSIEIHERLFARPPTLVAADAAFYNADNVARASERGVKHVAIPNKRSRSEEVRRRQRSRTFRRAQAWRTGCEGRISSLKRCNGLDRCRYRGEQGMERWVALGVIANNVVRIARQTKRR